MPAYIVTSQAKLTEGNFTIQTQNKITGMKDNPNFPRPTHSIEDVETKFTAFKALSKDKYKMSPKDTKDRNDLRKELNVMLRDNGLYVIATFPNDREKQLSSGYEPVKEPNRDGKAADPTGVKASTGDRNGEVKLYWKKSPNSLGYSIKYRIKGSDDAWQYKSEPKSRGVVIDGLESGEMYEFWILALGAKKDSNYGGPGEARAK